MGNPLNMALQGFVGTTQNHLHTILKDIVMSLSHSSKIDLLHQEANRVDKCGIFVQINNVWKDLEFEVALLDKIPNTHKNLILWKIVGLKMSNVKLFNFVSIVSLILRRTYSPARDI